ncbi:MAG: histidine triad (HIT) family protein [Parasphingorhabdus sp.]
MEIFLKFSDNQQQINSSNHRRLKIMIESTLFTKIINKEIPSDTIYQDEYVTVFRDINPQAPTHALIVTNKPIPSVTEVEAEDEMALGRMLITARKIAESEGISDSGYRLIINCGADGHQEVPHIHMHLLGGRDLGRMVSQQS